MELLEVIKERHSVRSYTDKKIEQDKIKQLQDMIDICNRESGLHMQLVTEEPKAFDGLMDHYGKFSGVVNYIAIVGKKGSDVQEKCGYYGEKLVLLAGQLGLNTCWVAMTFKKVSGAFKVESGEKLHLVIAIGYGVTQGVSHKVKSPSEVSVVNGKMPEWFKNGVEAALLAPTAMNQQKFTLTLDGNQVSAKAGIGFYSKIDLGIVKYHFEIGAGTDNFSWK